MATADRLNENNVFDFAHRWSGDAIELDLSETHVERVAASVLTACLLTSAAERKLNLKLPEGRPRQEILARNGLLFAVANRPGPVSFQPSKPTEASLAEWRRQWTRGTREPLLGLFQDEGALEPSVFGRDYAAFINPHRAGGAATSTSGVAEVVRPWLHRMMPKLTTDSERSPLGLEFVQSVGRLVNELVENVVEHAAARRSMEVHSLVLVSVARGGEASSRYRLHILVMDTGPGIVETASRKVSSERTEAGLWSLAERSALFRDLFRGVGGQLGRARGFGLPSVLATTRRWEGGRLLAVSNGLMLRDDKDSDLVVDQVAHVMNGSIVSAMMTIPPQTRTD